MTRICVESFGCSSNLADGQVLAGCLAEAGYEIVSSTEDAELIVVNTCAVKGPTENRMIEILKRVPQSKKLVVVGCLPLIDLDRIKTEARFDGMAGPAPGQKILELVRRVSNGEKAVLLEDAQKSMPSLRLPRAQTSPVISIIPICYGCLGSCAYCCVTHARGSLRSHEINEIVHRVKADVATGFQEFWLTAQDTACYGRDKGTNLADLLSALTSIEGDFMIRVGMMTPNAASDILSDLVGAFKNDHIFKFVHLPVQSGDDKVLKMMRRQYSVREFKDVVSVFRSSFTDLSLSTDVICGFPGESWEAFERTLSLIDEIKPDVVNVSKFFARPRTPAAAMQRSFVQNSEIKRRSETVARRVKKLLFEKNLRWVGWRGKVLIDETGKVPGCWIGRNFAYKPIVIRSSLNILGKIMHAEVVEAFPTYLKAEALG